MEGVGSVHFSNFLCRMQIKARQGTHAFLGSFGWDEPVTMLNGFREQLNFGRPFPLKFTFRVFFLVVLGRSGAWVPKTFFDSVLRPEIRSSL
jgi:hypothetical protein